MNGHGLSRAEEIFQDNPWPFELAGWVEPAKDIPPRLKPRLFLAYPLARLKPCPFKAAAVHDTDKAAAVHDSDSKCDCPGFRRLIDDRSAKSAKLLFPITGRSSIIGCQLFLKTTDVHIRPLEPHFRVLRRGLSISFRKGVQRSIPKAHRIKGQISPPLPFRKVWVIKPQTGCLFGKPMPMIRECRNRNGNEQLHQTSSVRGVHPGQRYGLGSPPRRFRFPPRRQLRLK